MDLLRRSIAALSNWSRILRGSFFLSQRLCLLLPFLLLRQIITLRRAEQQPSQYTFI